MGSLQKSLIMSTKVESEQPRPSKAKEMTHPEVKIPSYIGQSITSAFVFIMGITMKADWLLFWAYYQKSQEKLSANISMLNEDLTQDVYNGTANESITHHDLAWNDNVRLFVELRFANFFDYFIPASIISYIFFFGVGGYLHIAYYVNRRDKPEEWKCQPYQWLPRDLEIHEIAVGAFSLALGSFISAAMACWVLNDGYSKIYFDHTEHGYLWLVLQTPLIF